MFFKDMKEQKEEEAPNIQKAGLIANVDPQEAKKHPEQYLDTEEPYAQVYGLPQAISRVRFEQGGRFFDHEGKVVEVTVEL